LHPPTSLWLGPLPLLLASKSASRRQLLQSAGIDCDVEMAAIDERALEQRFLQEGGAPDRLAALLAREKALGVSARWPGRLCLGADQTLTLAREIFHKADSVAAAAASLARLAGRTHTLTSALCLARAGEVLFETQERAHMTMRALDAPAIARYLELAGPAALASVGAYQVEGLGVHLFAAIDGDHATILGLPMLKLLAWLRGEGLLAL